MTTSDTTPQPCPICGGIMTMMWGCDWDYDRWVCTEPVDPTARIKRLCPGEIELDTTSYPPGFDESQLEDER
ncbi:MAG: hypothetical protein H7842_02425 [Gammaproteobacteria bacterium SHHR-1]